MSETTTSQPTTAAKTSAATQKVSISTKLETTTSTPPTNAARVITTTTRISTKVVASTTSTTPQAISSTSKMIPRMPQRTPIFNQTDINESKATETLKDYEEVEDEHEVSNEPDFQPTGANESDNFVNEKYMMRETRKDEAVDVSLIIKVSVIAISALFLSSLVFVAVYRTYKESTNPLNYKEKNENGSRKANEEFSEIRYLTSDETLDFNLATPENATEL